VNIHIFAFIIVDILRCDLYSKSFSVWLGFIEYGGDGPKIWMEAATLLNERSRVTEKGMALQLGGWAWG
jgi:hypothetical protein